MRPSRTDERMRREGWEDGYYATYDDSEVLLPFGYNLLEVTWSD